MKMKDIQIGEDYAIGAPNTRYDTYRRVRGRVTRIGVHGTTSTSWGSAHMSERANYVEFEVVKDGGATGCDSRYQHRIVKDPSYPAHGGERTPGGYMNQGKDEKVLKVNRCLGAHVTMLWSDFEARVREHEKHEANAQRIKDQKDLEANDIRRRFKELGFGARGYKTYLFEFDTEDALEILAQLDMLRLLRLRGGSAGQLPVPDGDSSS